MFSQSYFVGVDSGSSISVHCLLGCNCLFHACVVEKCRDNQMMQVSFLFNKLIWFLACPDGAFLVCFCFMRGAFLPDHVVSILVMRLCYFVYIASAFLSGHLTSMMHFLPCPFASCGLICCQFCSYYKNI